MKNKMMRIASVLLVAALITTCAISGTFAKYVTKVEGSDKARVAKWGIILTVNADGTFADKYAAEDASYLEAGGEYSVVSFNGDKVVAPGTSSKLAKTQLKATVKGTPEVATRYILEAKVTSDIYLGKGEYVDYTQLVLPKADETVTEEPIATDTTGADGDEEPATTEPADAYGYFETFTLDEAYAPIKWNMTIAKGTGTPINLVDKLYEALADQPALLAAAEAQGFSREGCSIFAAVNILKKVAGTAAEGEQSAYEKIVDKALSNIVSGGRNFQLDIAEDGTLKLSYDFDPNKDMDFTFTLDWAWAFENGEELKDEDGNKTGIFEFDAADTFLGNWAAVVYGEQEIEGFEAPEDGSLELGATLKATAVQID
jgi:hypothetical protein